MIAARTAVCAQVPEVDGVIDVGATTPDTRSGIRGLIALGERHRGIVNAISDDMSALRTQRVDHRVVGTQHEGGLVRQLGNHCAPAIRDHL